MSCPREPQYVDLFAVDVEADGDVYHWAMYPPTDSVEDPDGTGDQQGRVNILISWLQANGQRDDVEQAARVAAADTLQKAAAAGGQELTSLASAFVKQDNFTEWGNNYQISHYVYGCHSITTGDDWIYVQQRCLFYAGGAYKGKIEWYKGGAGACAYWYLDTINLDTVLKGYDYNPSAVGLQQSSPETANNVTQVTSGVSWNIGGEVSVGKEGPSAKISGGVTISNSTTVNVQDCETVNKSASRNNNAAWSFQFNKSNSIAYIGYAGVTDPPKLATTTFQPFNQWIWRVSPSARAATPPMHVKFSVSLVGTTGMWGLHVGGPPGSLVARRRQLGIRRALRLSADRGVVVRVPFHRRADAIRTHQARNASDRLPHSRGLQPVCLRWPICRGLQRATGKGVDARFTPASR